MLQYRLLSKSAKKPIKGSKGSAGYDLCAAESLTIKSGYRKLISTGIALKIPDGYYGRIAPRSGLAVSHGINVGAGVIDNDYRGEIKVLLFNHGESDFTINEGDRIAQIILEPYLVAELLESELDDTVRGAGGFGSTGIGSN